MEACPEQQEATAATADTAPDPAIYPGIVGDIVDAFAPHTEAHPIAIATQFIVAFGNAVGRGPCFYVGETRHGVNEFAVIVGRSARARKGDSLNIALRPLKDADGGWATRVMSGLSSGEGLISTLAIDPSDGRLLVIETEFASPLKHGTRQGNILSNVLRDAWDSRDTLQTLTRNSPLRADHPHISIIAHCTPEDLTTYLSDVDAANGFGNRFLFVLVDRAQLLASPSKASNDVIRRLADEVGNTLQFARRIGQLQRDPDGESYWQKLYPWLSEDKPGLVGKLTARSEAHVVRLSALYALLARRREITTDDIHAARRLWEFSERSVRAIFGERTGNKFADEIAKRLMTPGTSLTTTEIRQLFSNHLPPGEPEFALSVLEQTGQFLVQRRPTGGRPALTITRL
jgi:hypothetical protein